MKYRLKQYFWTHSKKQDRSKWGIKNAYFCICTLYSAFIKKTSRHSTALTWPVQLEHMALTAKALGINDYFSSFIAFHQLAASRRCVSLKWLLVYEMQSSCNGRIHDSFVPRTPPCLLWLTWIEVVPRSKMRMIWPVLRLTWKVWSRSRRWPNTSMLTRLHENTRGTLRSALLRWFTRAGHNCSE